MGARDNHSMMGAIMNFDNSRDIIASYSDSSYSSITNTTINNYITNSFNRTHTGHNAGGGCAVVFLILGMVPLAGFIVFLMWLAEVLT